MIVPVGISLVMSASIPEAFGSRGLAFAVSCVAIQVLRRGFMVLALRGRPMERNYAQLLAWSAISGAVWIAGALAHGDARLWLWIAALVLDLGAPLHEFRLPGVSGTPLEAWTLAGGHLAERCQLVLLIALGESVLRVGATFGAEHGRAAVDSAFVVGFVTTVSLWAIYFLHHAEEGARSMAIATGAAARMGRSGYAYAHAIMVAGVIVVAVGIRLAIGDPEGSSTTAVAATVLGGPAIYLAGDALAEPACSTAEPAWPAAEATARRLSSSPAPACRSPVLVPRWFGSYAHARAVPTRVLETSSRRLRRRADPAVTQRRQRPRRRPDDDSSHPHARGAGPRRGRRDRRRRRVCRGDPHPRSTVVRWIARAPRCVVLRCSHLPRRC